MNLIPSYYDKNSKIWSGAKEEVYYHHDCSIGKVIFNAMKNYPKKIIQTFDIDNVALTNNDFLTIAIRIAQHFKAMGLCQEDVVGIAARNTTYAAPAAIACLFHCTPFHAVNPAYDNTTLTHMFNITKPKVIFCDGQDFEKMELVTEDFKPKIYTVTDHIEGVSNVQDLLEQTRTEHFYKPETLLLGGDQTVVIQCSSGTTGLPKAVCISNHKLMGITTSFLTSEDIIYSPSGLDWMSGFITMLMSCALGSTRIISNKRFSADHFVELVKKYSVTYSFIPPEHIKSLIKCAAATPESLASLRILSSGGSIIALSSLQALQSLLKNARITFGYGMTEIGGIAVNFGFDKATSSGKLLPGVQVRIVDDDGKSLGPNEVGEIFVHHGKTWNGYYGNPIETQLILDSDGWYHTGDLGYFDEEHCLYVVDRKKDILKYQGMHYWPGEIEHCIIELPGVADVCVIGVYDESKGDLAGALVVKIEGSTLSGEDVQNYVKEQLVMPHKQLHGGVLFVEKLPRNENGKTIRRDAKALFVAVKGGLRR